MPFSDLFVFFLEHLDQWLFNLLSFRIHQWDHVFRIVSEFFRVSVLSLLCLAAVRGGSPLLLPPSKELWVGHLELLEHHVDLCVLVAAEVQEFKLAQLLLKLRLLPFAELFLQCRFCILVYFDLLDAFARVFTESFLYSAKLLRHGTRHVVDI